MNKRILSFLFFAVYFLFQPIILFAQNKDSFETISLAEIQTNSSQTIALLLKQLHQAETDKNDQQIAKISSQLALTYYYAGDYENNRKYALQAIQFFNQLKDYKSLAYEYGELGFRLKSIDLKSAESYMQKGMSIAQKHNSQKQLISIYNNFGVIKRLLNQADSALMYHQKSIAICTKYNDSISLPYSLNNIGTLYLEQKKYELAEANFEKALQIRKNLKDAYGISDNYAYSGDLYFAQKNYAKAITAFLHSLKIADSLKISNLILYNYKQLAESYKLNGDTKNALFFADRRQDFGDSLINIQTNDKIIKYQIQFETAEKEKQILQQQLEAKKRKTTILLLTFLAIILIITSYFIYRNLKIKNKQQQQEFELNEARILIEHQKQLDEQRLTISRDLHDNIGSQLTFIISSIDTLKYALKITDDKINQRMTSISDFTRTTITDLRDTIWAMNQAEIGFQEMKNRIENFIYKAKNLGQGLAFNFEIDEELNRYTFSSTQGMNIYRIIQEACNNVIKYANASQINIKILKTKQQIEIAIEDDGIGFDTSKNYNGNGLLNMKKRIQSIEGTLKISSTKGKTQILCTFPIIP